MSLYSTLVTTDGDIRTAEWDRRAAANLPVGRCPELSCRLGLVYAAPADRPEYGTVTYYTATCSQCGAEQVTVGRFRGTVIPDPSELEIRDITTSQHDED